MDTANRIENRAVKTASVAPCQLSVKVVNPHLDSRWERFVSQHPGALIYHHLSWLSALEKEYGQQCVCLACEDSLGELVGVLPLMRTRGFPLSKRKPLVGARLASLPRTPIAGPLTVSSNVTVLLLQEAVRRVSVESGICLQIKTQGPELCGLIEGVVAKSWRLSYVLRFPENVEGMFQIADGKNRSKVKRSINKAVASGLKIRIAETEEDLASWYRLYLDVMRRNFVLARPYRFFLALCEFMKPNGLMRLLLAERQAEGKTRIVGGHIYFTFGKTMTYAFGASHAEDFVYRPNDFIMWHAINDAYCEGFKYFDLGEAPDGDEGLVRFKSKWGAEPVQLYRYYFPDFADASHSTEDSKSTLAEIFKRLWRRVPLRVTSWIGDLVYARL